MQYKLGELAEVINAELKGDPNCVISGLGTLQNAGPDQLSFFTNRRYARFLKSTTAAAVVLSAEDMNDCPVFSLVSKDPYLAYAKAVRYMNPEQPSDPGVHPSAIVSVTASIHSSACICANSYIGEHVQIDENIYIGPGCVVEDNSVIGNGSRLIANVSVCHNIKIGERVLMHAGVVIGADGFGITNEAGKWLKIPQLGSVEIKNDVEIGANTTIDRGALGNTLIEEGVKIDNQVQIGHNSIIGAHTAIAGCVVIAGSVTIGKRCMIGGGTAIAGHIVITDDVVITGLSGVTNSIKEAGTYSGAMTITDNLTWRKNMARFRHLNELAIRLKAVEDKLDKSS